MKQRPKDFLFSIYNAIIANNYSEVQRIVNQLQINSIDIDELAFKGVTPLLRAIYCDHIELVKLLLEAGSDINKAFKGEKTAFDFAKENPAIHTLLLKHHQEKVNIGYIYPIDQNGNCMYNAILEGYRRIGFTNSDYNNAETLRAAVISVILSSQEYIERLESQLIANIRDNDIYGFAPDMQEEISALHDALTRGEKISVSELLTRYINSIGTASNWGGNVELGIINSILGVQIIVHRTDGLVIAVNDSENQDAPEIHLHYDGAHYDLIISATFTKTESEISSNGYDGDIDTSDEDQEIIPPIENYYYNHYLEMAIVALLAIGYTMFYDDSHL